MNPGETCSANTQLVVALSGITNAHAAATPSAAYPYRVCCSMRGAQILSAHWYSGVQQISGIGSAYSVTTPFPFAVGNKVKLVLTTKYISQAGLEQLKIEVRDIDKDVDGVDDQSDDSATGVLTPIP